MARTLGVGSRGTLAAAALAFMLLANLAGALVLVPALSRFLLGAAGASHAGAP